MTAPEPAPATLSELEALLAELGITDDRLVHTTRYDLDGEVHDAKSAEAAEINNAGLSAQVAYLCAGMTPDEARDWMTHFFPGDDA